MEFVALVFGISACSMVHRYLEHREEMARIEKGIEGSEPEPGFVFQIGDEKRAE